MGEPARLADSIKIRRPYDKDDAAPRVTRPASATPGPLERARSGRGTTAQTALMAVMKGHRLQAGVCRRAGDGTVPRFLAANGHALHCSGFGDRHRGCRGLARAAADVGARGSTSVILIHTEPRVSPDLEAATRWGGDHRGHTAEGDGGRDRCARRCGAAFALNRTQ